MYNTYMKLIDILRGERLDEMSYSTSIMNWPSYSNLLNRKDLRHSIDFIKEQWPKTKENYGVEDLHELIRIEIENLPKPKSLYSKLSDQEKEDFWKKVEFIEKELKNG